MTLSDDRCLSAEPTRRGVGRELYAGVHDMPLVCPHGHVDPRLLADADATLGTPAELFIIPDHYVTRMLYSRGVAMEDLGVERRDGGAVERDHRAIWQRFAEHFFLFRGTPTGLWLRDELALFGVSERLDGASAQRIYDVIAGRLALPEYRPRALLDRFGIETLCTTDAATDDLAAHTSLLASGEGRVRPTFRPDGVVNILTPGWQSNLTRLGELVGGEIGDAQGLLRALEQRRVHFKQTGAVATDHAAETAYTGRLSDAEAGRIFAAALRGDASEHDATAFTGHMLLELARMSAEDGLVMQLHIGSMRNHHSQIFAQFGADMGADIPLSTEWTRSLRPLLNAYGADPRFRIILFTLDESSYSRELAPIAGHYPAVLLGPPWWFHDSVNGMRRFLERAVETAGLHNLAGFNDDTRAFASIPARHDVWRRVTCDWLAGMVAEHTIELDEAHEMAEACAVGLARKAYRLG